MKFHISKGTPWHGESKSTVRTWCGRIVEVSQTEEGEHKASDICLTCERLVFKKWNLPR